MDILEKIAEEKIREAIENGEFKNLPGKGKPLNLEDLSTVPEDLRMGYKIMKNAGVVPEEMQLQKEILSLHDLLNCCHDDQERELLKKKLSEKMLRFNSLMEKRKMPGTSAFRTYQSKLYDKFNR
ncbi:DUF1992 domain-containing protein [Effusibacillus lacus]|uniref:DUF1992 domain-containing protein n=1 Tax=Effusibacillus lacus TaxID=1348429 RepID=A0A292YRV3_9BACL|nr:DUF1992 domain-containing protein [Effusibacillus lacus]TCS76857.1 uncharacterized protein DUF1992 [Effusibacillus lacus]GAX91190.1 DUF1992 domain-containing protein [Effusibacillus lacus]